MDSSLLSGEKKSPGHARRWVHVSVKNTCENNVFTVTECRCQQKRPLHSGNPSQTVAARVNCGALAARRRCTRKALPTKLSLVFCQRRSG
jgi:hypothetical protein